MKQLRSSSLFWAEEGFSTIGMVLALLISISLIFTAARVYEINSCSSRVQEVADAAALAAENTVGEFYLVAGICDAVLLSLSLTTAGCLGLSVVCACVPPASGFSKTFLEMAQKTKKARDSFSESANESLERLAQALPFIAAVKAQEVYSANSSLSDGAHYQGIVVLSPWEVETGDSLSFHDSDESLSEVEQSRDSLEDVAGKPKKRRSGQMSGSSMGTSMIPSALMHIACTNERRSLQEWRAPITHSFLRSIPGASVLPWSVQRHTTGFVIRPRLRTGNRWMSCRTLL